MHHHDSTLGNHLRVGIALGEVAPALAQDPEGIQVGEHARGIRLVLRRAVCDVLPQPLTDPSSGVELRREIILGCRVHKTW